MVWNHHFFASTRGRIVLLLRREEHTVDELAQSLKLTDNAVRAHLATLERDGFVSPTSTRRGSSKPAIIYALTPGADRLFPKAYAPVLQQLLDTLSTCLPAGKVAEIMEQTGQRLATQWSVTPGALHARVQQAVAILNQLGGLAELEEQDTSYVIQGYSCPFAAIAPNAPEICHLAQALLVSLIGEPVEEHCECGGTARCRFTLSKI
jgi:predicted ArsR family transcriptional regulator